MGIKTHGHRAKRTKEHTAWVHMIQRCTNPKHPYYKSYGGRGIKVCKRWLKFEHFLEDVGLSPSPKHSLDRFPDNNGDYEPSNFRWATTTEQNSNQRRTKFITHNSVTKTLTQWANDTSIGLKTLHYRIKTGWPIDLALTKRPALGFKRKNKTP